MPFSLSALEMEAVIIFFIELFSFVAVVMLQRVSFVILRQIFVLPAQGMVVLAHMRTLIRKCVIPWTITTQYNRNSEAN